MATEIKFTDRELAIARGEDPDLIEATPDSTILSQPDTDHVEEITDEQSPVGETTTEDEEPTEPSWINDDVRSLASSYGMTDEDLNGFETEDAFRKAGLLLDRQLVDSKPAAQEEAKEETKDEAKADPEEEALIDPQWYIDNDYDAETVKMAKALRRQQELRREDRQAIEQMTQRWQQFETHIQAQEVQRQAEEFHTAVDQLDEKLFGKAWDDKGTANNLDKKHHENRAKLWEAAQTLEAGIIARAQAKGVPPELPPTSVLMKRAYQIAFPETISSDKRNKRIEDAKTQSAKRRPVGTQGAALPNRVAESSDPVALADHPAIKEWWQKNVKS